jgi:hypothetical protein
MSLIPSRACRFGLTFACAWTACLGATAGPHAKQAVRFATFNVTMYGSQAGQIADQMVNGPPVRAWAMVAELVQIYRPDVLLLNEFDYDAAGAGINAFVNNYLNVPQNEVGQGPRIPIDYPYVYWCPSNTGVHSGHDFDNNGIIDTTPGSENYANDCYGFGLFEGQYGLAILSKYEILIDEVRTFQQFKWKDMPGALEPVHGDGTPYYESAEWADFRLSSKNHVDVPVDIHGQTVHVLASHPTPPVFDDDTVDWNGKRNHDEIRFWADYVTPGTGGYIYDDAGRPGPLDTGEAFVIMGDQNADTDPNRGDGIDYAINQVLDSPTVNGAFTPLSGIAGLYGFVGDETHRAGLRLDYVLPSVNLPVIGGAIPWFQNRTPEEPLNHASDHHMVTVDIRIVPEPNSVAIILLGAACLLLGHRRSASPLKAADAGSGP